jgi:hypothetical protein
MTDPQSPGPLSSKSPSVPPEMPSEVPRTDLKRTLKDLLVADDIDDSDIEMLDKPPLEDEKLEDEDVVDPEMCVECGDQVPLSRARLM